jgi:CsoR family transcriptional regulator, copper-sensing transcriptional repressor
MLDKEISKKPSKHPEHKHSAHDHSAELKRLSRIKGQVEGVERMINERRYCPEIVQQIKAIRSALKSLEASVVEGHMRHCVKEAIASRDAFVVQEKIEEIILLVKGQG